LATSSRELLANYPEQSERHPRQYPVVLETMTELEHNANAALAVEALVTRLRRV
jgi:hypothetical protein